MSIWYVRRKTCTYFASRLALSPNGLNRASTWALSPRSTIECIQNEFQAYGTFGVNCASILRQGLHYLQTDWIELWLEPRHIRVSLGASKTISSLWYVRRKSSSFLTSTLTQSPNGPNRDSTWPKSPSSYLRCVQNGFWPCGIFGTKRAPILHQN
jgi:hypothetical protein